MINIVFFYFLTRRQVNISHLFNYYRIFPLTVTTSETIEDVKEKIFDKDNKFPPSQQRLGYDRHLFNPFSIMDQLEDGRTLDHYVIRKGSTLILTLAPEEGL